MRLLPPQFGHSTGSSVVTISFPQLPQYQTGILWPHQICLDMHQSLMLFIHSKYVFSHMEGRILVLPFITAAVATFARGFIFTNH